MQSYKRNGDKIECNLNVSDLHFITILATKKGFYLNWKIDSMTLADGRDAFCLGTKTSQGLLVCLEDKVVHLRFSLYKAAAFILSEVAKHRLLRKLRPPKTKT